MGCDLGKCLASTTKKLQSALLLVLMLVSANANARTWKLDYQLTGIIVVIELHGHLLYTDMASVEANLTTDGVIENGPFDSSDSKLFALITDKRSLRTTDTIHLDCWEIMGWNRDFDSPEESTFNQVEYAKTLYPDELIIKLAEAKRLRIFDKVRKRDVRTIHAKDSGSHEHFDLRVSYLDPATGKEIFAARPYIHLGNPKF